MELGCWVCDISAFSDIRDAHLRKERNTARRKRAQVGFQNAPKVHNYTIAPEAGALYQNCRLFSSVPTIGTASELVRYDGLAFLYAFPGPLPPSLPRFRRITRFVLRPGALLLVNCLHTSPGTSIFCFIPRGCRVRRVMRVSV